MRAGARILVALVVALLVLGTPAVALGQYVGPDVVVPPPPSAQGAELSRGAGGVSSASGARAGRRDGSTIPVTGGDVAALTIVGIAAVGAGAILIRRNRRQEGETA